MKTFMSIVAMGLLCTFGSAPANADCASVKTLEKQQAQAQKCADRARAGNPCGRMQVDKLVRRLDSYTKRTARDTRNCDAAAITAAQKKTDELKAALRSNQKESLKEKRARGRAAENQMTLGFEFSRLSAPGAEALKALEMGEANPPQGYPSPNKAMRAARSLGKLNAVKADCDGKYKDVAKLADKCRRLKNGMKLMENFLEASGLATAKAKTARIQKMIKRYRKYPAIAAADYLYVTDWDTSLKQDTKDVAFLFKAAGRPMGADVMAQLIAARAEFLKAVDEIAPTVKPPKGHKKNKKLYAAMKKSWKGAKVKIAKNGKVVEVATKPLTAYFSGNWKITTNALGQPLHRSQAAFTVYRVPGEKFCRRTYGVMGTNYIAQGHLRRNKYEKVGDGHFVLKQFVFQKCK